MGREKNEIKIINQIKMELKDANVIVTKADNRQFANNVI
jgi:hypothetical protein